MTIYTPLSQYSIMKKHEILSAWETMKMIYKEDLTKKEQQKIDLAEQRLLADQMRFIKSIIDNKSILYINANLVLRGEVDLDVAYKTSREFVDFVEKKFINTKKNILQISPEKYNKQIHINTFYRKFKGYVDLDWLRKMKI